MTLPTVVVEFSPGEGPFDTPAWVDVSSLVLGLETSDGKQADLGEFPPGEATIELVNDDRLFDPEHAAGTYYGDLLPRVPFRVWVTVSRDLAWDADELTWDADTMTWTSADTSLFYGFVEDGWEQFYEPPAIATCRVKLVDLLGVLSGYPLPSVYEVEVLADNPAALWMLDETSGSVMADRSAYGITGTYSAGTTALATTIESADGAHIPAIDFDGDHYGLVPYGPFIGFDEPILECVFDMDGYDWTGSGDYLSLVTLSDGNGLGNFHMISVRDLTTTTASIRYWAGDTAGYAYYDSEPFSNRGVHHVMAGIFQSIYLDGALIYDSVGSLPDNQSIKSGVWVSGSTTFGGADGPYPGPISSVAIYGGGSGGSLSAARVLAHAEAALNPLGGQTADQQIQWALDTIGVPAGMYDLDVGVSPMGPANTKGRNALEFIRDVAATEAGSVYVAHHDNGKIRFRNRYSSFTETRSTVTQATFSDDPAASDEDVYRVDPDRLEIEPNGIGTVVNQASVTWAGGTEVVDESTGSPYGPRPVTINTLAPSPLIAKAIGQWHLALNGEPKARIRSLGVNPGENDAEWDAVAIRIGDRIAYRSHPQEAGTATTKALEVIGRHHKMQGMRWEADFYATAAPADGVTLFTLGTSTLGGTHVLAY